MVKLFSMEHDHFATWNCVANKGFLGGFKHVFVRISGMIRKNEIDQFGDTCIIDCVRHFAGVFTMFDCKCNVHVFFMWVRQIAKMYGLQGKIPSKNG